MPFPAVFTTEGSRAEARLGFFTRIRSRGNRVRLEYAFYPDVPPIPNSALARLAWDLDIGDWELRRTRKPNIMYETGIAHTLGRQVVPITQSMHDVPFDLRHHRVLKYLPNGEGLTAMQAALPDRLRTLTSDSTVR